ncbi:MAG: sulfotransferase [Actinomycetota bacterium]
MKVLYILGRGRSGSTILGNVIGAVPGFFSAGELRYLWDPVVIWQSPCGCGVPIAECAVWATILGRLDDVDLEQVVAWQHEIVRETNIYRLLDARGGRSWPALRRYAAVTERLYRTIVDVTGCDVIVDSSKRPSYAAFIRRLEDCDPYFIHLARDPRASAYSWLGRRYVSPHGGEVPRRNAIDSTLRWNLLNLGSETLLKRVAGERQMYLRYEDFVAAPLETVTDVCALVGESDRPLPFIDERTVMLDANHTIAGNPSRFSSGRLELRDTAEWRTQQDRVSRWLATVVALPYLRRYGYSMRV